MSLKVISGFQTGADFAAVRAAHDLGIPTGGTMPYGFRTQAGPKPEYAELYGAVEDKFSSYTHRTGLNVKNSDATVCIAAYFSSAGERCTRRFIWKYQKPSLSIEWLGGDRFKVLHSPLSLSGWLLANGWNVLNVAGNSYATAPGIEQAAYDYLIDQFSFYLVTSETY